MKAHVLFLLYSSHLVLVTDSLKSKSWLGANNFLVRQAAAVRHNSSALAELNGNIYVFGGLNGPGGKQLGVNKRKC